MPLDCDRICGRIVLRSSDCVSASPWIAAAGIAYSAGTLAAFLFSVYHGLFGFTERLSGSWQEAAAAVELAAIVVLLVLFGTLWQTADSVHP